MTSNLSGTHGTVTLHTSEVTRPRTSGTPGATPAARAWNRARPPRAGSKPFPFCIHSRVPVGGGPSGHTRGRPGRGRAAVRRGRGPGRGSEPPTRGQSARGVRRPRPGPRPAPPPGAAMAEAAPGRGGAEPRGILESARRWGFWEESSISSLAPASPLRRHPRCRRAASRGAEPAAAAAAGECWACTCRTGSPSSRPACRTGWGSTRPAESRRWVTGRPPLRRPGAAGRGPRGRPGPAGGPVRAGLRAAVPRQGRPRAPRSGPGGRPAAPRQDVSPPPAGSGPDAPSLLPGTGGRARARLRVGSARGGGGGGPHRRARSPAAALLPLGGGPAAAGSGSRSALARGLFPPVDAGRCPLADPRTSGLPPPPFPL